MTDEELLARYREALARTTRLLVDAWSELAGLQRAFAEAQDKLLNAARLLADLPVEVQPSVV